MHRYHFLYAVIIAAFMVSSGAGCEWGGTTEEVNTAEDDGQTTTLPTEETVEPPEPMDGERSVRGRIEDAQLAARVKQAIAGERSLRTFDFEPEVTDGRVTLHGDVRSRDQYERAESIAQDVDGVRDVTNAITVEGQQVLAEREEEAGSEDASDEEETATADGTSEPAGAEYHTVQAGESLWTIARNNNTSVSRLRDLNNLSSNNLQPGDRIRVR